MIEIFITSSQSLRNAEVIKGNSSREERKRLLETLLDIL